MMEDVFDNGYQMKTCPNVNEWKDKTKEKTKPAANVVSARRGKNRFHENTVV
jgi:hypothetical protein